MLKNKHTLYTEIYRPTTLDKFLCSDEVKEKVSEYIKNQDIPNLILSGGAGLGKTTLAKILVGNIDCTSLYINASDENGIETVREKIKGFASTASFKKKIIILDEADYLTGNAQSALRSIIETYSASTKFIFTCNFPERIIDPIHSRLHNIKIEPAEKINVVKRIIEILKENDIKFGKEDVLKILETFYPDLRRLLNHLQANIKDKVLSLGKNELELDYKEQILSYILKKDKTSFNEIRKIVAENDIKDFTSLYRYLFDSIEVLPEKNRENTILNLAKYQFQNNFSIDKEINFMGLIIEILK